MACTTDSYESGDGELSYLRADFADAYTDADAKVKYVLTDDGDSITFSPSADVISSAKPDTFYRGVLYYHAYTDGSREAYHFSRVGMIGVSEKLPDDSVCYDPMDLESSWKAKNGKYINLGLVFKSADVEGDSHQKLGLMLDTIRIYPNGRRTAEIKFLHWQNDVPEYYSVKYYFTIPLTIFREALRHGDSIRVSMNTYDGMVRKTFVY